ncbi:membrane protein [Pandoraea horticolens]|uniref:Membrane protein n=1 Tax=Pandoraea horticolens TaxID=2508298 RepID=A0A5E4TGQ5_9BURK|nr:iron transporter [Pandoraea horticolens]VVD86422.1 membrane protein [Pandoraea horticolens]
MRVKSLVAAVLLAGAATLAQAAEFPIGKPFNAAGMEINTVYLQPVTMEPAGMMHDAAKSDIHLEADIHAIAKNPNGYAEGDWIPGLEITYELQKMKDGKPDGAAVKGLMMPMVASDGPHYGDNVKLAGVGKYKLTMVVNAPGTLQEFGCKMGGTAAAGAHATHGGMGPWCFGRHVDKETGVGPWFKPITKEADFTFSGIGKKGGY